MLPWQQGNGRLKVYDMEEKCFESDIKITESKHGKSVRLVRPLPLTPSHPHTDHTHPLQSCLLLVRQHVWVGSFSRNIHILDAETVCREYNTHHL